MPDTENNEAVEPTSVETVEGVDQPRTEADLVVENPLSDEEQKVQEQHEALAADLAPGETLPWVAEPPSGVAEERAIEGAEAENPVPSDEDAEGPGSDIPSSRHETAENPPDTEETEDTDTRNT